MLEILKEKGVLAPYRSPSTAGYPDWATKDEHITLFGIEYVSSLYNTDHVKAADAPARYADLADHKWKNKTVMADPATHARAQEHTSELQTLMRTTYAVF